MAQQGKNFCSWGLLGLKLASCWHYFPFLGRFGATSARLGGHLGRMLRSLRAFLRFVMILGRFLLVLEGFGDGFGNVSPMFFHVLVESRDCKNIVFPLEKINKIKGSGFETLLKKR